jgi:NADPH:quinone reductase
MASLVDRGAIRATATQSTGAINATNLRQAHAAIEAGRTVGSSFWTASERRKWRLSC